MRLNTRSLSALEAGIDSSCNDKIQYSGKHADTALVIHFVVSLDIDVCTICL